nr:helix-turn-helix domain-containing protein [Deinococcus sp. NW-56]
MSRPLRYPVTLSAEQEQTLHGMTMKGSGKARVMTRARILLLAHRQVTDSAIKDALGISVQMVQATRKRFALGDWTRRCSLRRIRGDPRSSTAKTGRPSPRWRAVRRPKVTHNGVFACWQRRL